MRPNSATSRRAAARLVTVGVACCLFGVNAHSDSWPLFRGSRTQTGVAAG